MAQCFLCSGDALLQYDTGLTKKVSGIEVHVNVPIDVCATCKQAEQLRDGGGNAKLLGICVLVGIVISVIAQGDFVQHVISFIVGSAVGGLLTVPLKPLIIARSKFNEHPAVLAKKQEGYKLTNPSR